MKKIKTFGQFNENYNTENTKLKEKMSYNEWYKRYANDILDTYWIESDRNEPMEYTEEETLKNAYYDYLNEP